MFKEQTLFILGAGASLNYGYPLGHELIQKIISHIDDELYIPSDCQGGKSLSYELSKVINSMSELSYEEILSKHPSLGGPLKLCNVDGFRKLKEALQDFDPVSIDAFLNHHPSHAAAGKIMIVYTLLKCEDPDKFSRTATKDNWYRHLIADLLLGCQKPEQIGQNKLDIITFNYDLSLDYALKTRLLGCEFLKESEEAGNFINKLVSEIKHVHGCLYDDDPCRVYGDYNKHFVNLTLSDDRCNSAEQNTRRMQQAVKSKDNIKLVSEERGLNIKYREMIEKAKRVVIIGFGFDRDNLDRLGFPSSLLEYREFFREKELFYMNYGGKMRVLTRQFNFLGDKITCSDSEQISDAYQNDFKIRLY